MTKMDGMRIDVSYDESIEGGHAGAADNNQVTELKSMVYAYLMPLLRSVKKSLASNNGANSTGFAPFETLLVVIERYTAD